MIYYKIGLFLTRFLHGLVLFAMAGSLPYIILHTPAWIAFPITLMLLNFIWTGGARPLTDLENSFRNKLGFPIIQCFIGHYICKLLK